MLDFVRFDVCRFAPLQPVKLKKILDNVEKSKELLALGK